MQLNSALSFLFRGSGVMTYEGLVGGKTRAGSGVIPGRHLASTVVATASTLPSVATGARSRAPRSRFPPRHADVWNGRRRSRVLRVASWANTHPTRDPGSRAEGGSREEAALLSCQARVRAARLALLIGGERLKPLVRPVASWVTPLIEVRGRAVSGSTEAALSSPGARFSSSTIRGRYPESRRPRAIRNMQAVAVARRLSEARATKAMPIDVCGSIYIQEWPAYYFAGSSPLWAANFNRPLNWRPSFPRAARGLR